MNPLALIAAAGQTYQGVSNMIGKGKARRANRKSRKEQLKLLRAQLQGFDEEAPRQMTRLGEAQQGLEGGVANEREYNAKVAIQRQRERLLTAIKQAKRNKKAANSQDRMEVFGDLAGIVGKAAGGLSELYDRPELPMNEQVGMAYGGGMGALGFNPLDALGGALQGQQYARRRQLGLLRNGQ